ncbi:MAG TPA: hypothetical protein VE035_11120 [Puia sp.]|nr:hypothetical protein [Puia sp.]
MRAKKLFFWSGLFVIALLYCLYYIFFLYRIALDMPIRGRHVIKFCFIALVYASGAVCLRGYADKWMLRAWHLIYFLILGLLVLLGIYDWTIARTPLPVREIADTLLEFLISPILYVAMGIFSRRDG